MKELPSKKRWSTWLLLVIVSVLASCSDCSDEEIADPNNRLPEDRLLCQCQGCFFCNTGEHKDVNCPAANRVPAQSAEFGLPGTLCSSPQSCSHDESEMRRACGDACVQGSIFIAACETINASKENCDALGCKGAHSQSSLGVSPLGFAVPTDSIIELDPSSSFLVFHVEDERIVSPVTGHIYATGCTTPPCSIEFHRLELQAPDRELDDVSLRAIKGVNRQPISAELRADGTFLMDSQEADQFVTFNVDGDTPGSLQIFSPEAPTGIYDPESNRFTLSARWHGLPGTLYEDLQFDALVQGRFVDRAPVANAGDDQIVECNRPGGAQVQLDGSGSFDPDGAVDLYWMMGDPLLNVAAGARGVVELPIGNHRVSLVASGDRGLLAEDETQIIVRDTTPPRITSITMEPRCLWSPSHGFVRYRLGIEALVQALDVCATPEAPVSVRIANVTSSQADDGAGDGHTTDDVRFNDTTACLRTERAGLLKDRVYTIEVEATDAFGNRSTASTQVVVPHDVNGEQGCRSVEFEVLPEDTLLCELTSVPGDGVD